MANEKRTFAPDYTGRLDSDADFIARLRVCSGIVGVHRKYRITGPGTIAQGFVSDIYREGNQP